MLSRFVFLFLVLSSFFVHAQKNIQLVRSGLLKGIEKPDGTRYQVVLKGLFRHEGVEMEADSTQFYPKDNVCRAFGNISIRQGDSIRIKADRLHYFGKTKLAVLFGDVDLQKGNTELFTDRLDYHTANQIGVYKKWGKIINKKDTLVSKKGIYFSRTEEADFLDQVKVTSEENRIFCDTLTYFTRSKKYFFLGPSKIYSKQDTIFSDFGFYDGKTKKGELMKNNRYLKYPNELRAQHIDFDKGKGIYEALGQIFFQERKEDVFIRGHKGLYVDSTSSLRITKGANLSLNSADKENRDTIYIRADTILSRKMDVRKIGDIKPDFFRTPEDEIPAHKDSQNENVGNETSTANLIASPTLALEVSSGQTETLSVKKRIYQLLKNVKLFKKNSQLVADSVFYSEKDSILRAFLSPKMWGEKTQLSGDSAFVKIIKGSQMDRIKLTEKVFGVQMDKHKKFNQMKCRQLIAVFKKDSLKYIYMDGNAATLYHVWDSLKYMGVNRSVAGFMRVDIEDGDIRNFFFKAKPELKLIPPEQALKEDVLLSGFFWKPELRPKSKEEILSEYDSLKEEYTKQTEARYWKQKNLYLKRRKFSLLDEIKEDELDEKEGTN